jgi:hypothetical protein
VIILAETYGKIRRPGPEDAMHIPDIGRAVFRKNMVQEFPVVRKVKRAGHFVQVSKEIGDNKPAPGSPVFCMRFGDFNCCRRTVYAGHIEPETRKVDRIIAGTAPEIDGFAGTDYILPHKFNECSRRCFIVPREIFQRYGLVYPVDIGISHTSTLQE